MNITVACSLASLVYMSKSTEDYSVLFPLRSIEWPMRSSPFELPSQKPS